VIQVQIREDTHLAYPHSTTHNDVPQGYGLTCSYANSILQLSSEENTPGDVTLTIDSDELISPSLIELFTVLNESRSNVILRNESKEGIDYAKHVINQQHISSMRTQVNSNSKMIAR